jgi:hypothetical protein
MKLLLAAAIVAAFVSTAAPTGADSTDSIPHHKGGLQWTEKH